MPRLLAVHVEDPGAIVALGLLRHWDGSMAMNLPQPLIFNAWIDRFVDLVLQGAGISLANAGPRSEFATSAEYRAVRRCKACSTAPARWCGGDCADAVAAPPRWRRPSSTSATRFGPDPTAWRWDAAHQAVFAHPFLRQLPVIGDG